MEIRKKIDDVIEKKKEDLIEAFYLIITTLTSRTPDRRLISAARASRR